MQKLIVKRQKQKELLLKESTGGAVSVKNIEIPNTLVPKETRRFPMHQPKKANNNDVMSETNERQSREDGDELKQGGGLNDTCENYFHIKGPTTVVKEISPKLTDQIKQSRSRALHIGEQSFEFL